MKKNFYFVRHGALPKEVSGQFVGSKDIALSEEGVRQAMELRSYFEHLGSPAVFTSPQRRVVQTLELANPAWKFPYAQADNDLCELRFGEWEGRNIKDTCKEHPAFWERFVRGDETLLLPGGDSLRSFHKRIDNMAEKLRHTDNDTVVVFSHGGVLFHLIARMLGLDYSHAWSFRLDRGSLAKIEVDEMYGARLMALNWKPDGRFV